MSSALAPPVDEAQERQNFADAHLQRMLQSPAFQRAETQRRLLLYLYQHRHKSVSEYALATEALGRSPNFDSASDASVRVHISRLRRKLKDYYEGDTDEPEMLVIPTGSHQLLVLEPAAGAAREPRHATPAAEEAIEPVLLTPASGGRTSAWIGLVLTPLCLLLIVAVAVLAWKNRALQEQSIAAPAPNAFWAQFLQGTAPVKIILPTPVFFGFKSGPSFRLRSTKINEFNQIAEDPHFAALIERYGQPTLESSYTVTWDTLAAIDMARYLDSVGAKQRVSFDVTRDSSAMVLEQANVIMLGTHQTLHTLDDYLQSMNFSLGPSEAWVSNAKPLPGEQRRYDLAEQSKQRLVRPSIIAVLPGRAPGLKVLLLQSRHTGALVNMLSSSAGSRSIEDLWRSHGSPAFFEMVVDTELEGETALRSWPVTLHPYPSEAPINHM